MANDRKIKVNELDFLTIKENLKNYLSGLDEFSDFNFEGSGISILLDLLSYVTHYQGFYNNMVANEMFLDSAIKRTSVVSHAKSLGYTPSSKTSAEAIVDITINDDTTTTTTLTKRSKFTCQRDGTTYTFTNPDAGDFETLNATQKVIRNVTLKEGTWRNQSFVVDNNIDTQKFIISSKDVDMSTLGVRVQTSINDTTGYTDSWSAVSDITSLTSTTKAYYTQEVENGLYEIYFGDGILGTKLSDGNVIVLEYLITNGVLANDIGSQDTTYSRTFSSSDINVANISVVSASAGGGGKESINEIKFNAPKAFQSQNRSVTTNDYKTFISQNYSNAGDVFVWGGENNNPPEYGKVLISVKPTSGTVLSQEDKLGLQNLLKTQNLVSIIPEIVEPNYIYMKVKSNISYDSNTTTKSTSDIKTLVDSYIISYSVSELERFNRNFRYSKFVKVLDDADDSILGNETSIKIQKRIEVTVGKSKTYTIDFGNKIYHPHAGHMPVVESNAFTYTKLDGTVVNALLDDDGEGNIRIYEVINSVKSYLNKTAGTIDYSEGIISLKDFMPVSVDGTLLKIDIVPESKDIISERNGIIAIDLNDSDSVQTVVESYSPYSINSESSSGSVSVSSSTSSSSSSSSGSGY